MSIKWLYVTLIIACTAHAQERTPSVDLAAGDNDLLSLSWGSESNELYRVLFKTNLLQAQGTVLKDDYFATPPSNVVKIYRGSVPSAFLYVDVQPVLQSDLPYELLYPGSFSVSPGETNVVYSGQPTFVGHFCVTNEVQFESMKDELGLAGHTFDFSSEVLIGMMGPITQLPITWPPSNGFCSFPARNMVNCASEVLVNKAFDPRRLIQPNGAIDATSKIYSRERRAHPRGMGSVCGSLAPGATMTKRRPA
jgi:hypothetical protein